MRIAYGVMGYGRGHATRAAAVLPALMAQHEVTVFAGNDAYDALAPRFPTVRIPTLGYRYNGRGRHSLARTVAGNFSPVADVLIGGHGMDAVVREFSGRGIELVISDSEAWTHRAAQRLELPRISFDHVGIIAWCKPHFPPDLWLAGRRDAWAYRALMGEPDRVLISSFYPAEPARPGVRVVGPMLRDAVRAWTATDAPPEREYLLAYFNKGRHQYMREIDRALRLLDMPVVIYGTSFRGRNDKLDFRAPSQDGFVRDLAGCRAVIATAGNQLLGEAIHFRKPVLVVPEDAFEQRLNAFLVERMGVGARAAFDTFSASDVDRFLGNHAVYRERMDEYARDGYADAVATLQRYADELRRGRSCRRLKKPPPPRHAFA